MRVSIQTDPALATVRSDGSPTPSSALRRLIHIPVIHTQADMGSLGPAIQAISIQELGQQGWEQTVTLVNKIWSQIEQAIGSWSLPYSKVRLYQDGLPICGRELEIVTALAKAGSRNHQLLLHLKRQGATIMGTESAELLVREYKLTKEILAAHKSAQATHLEDRLKTLSKNLLQQRDQAVAERINRTLSPGEIGLLFLGMLHSLDKWIAKDIQITRPIHPGSRAKKPCG
ncbi:MAG: hypothetical protein ABSG50_14145 [Opitutaceae bacterium]